MLAYSSIANTGMAMATLVITTHQATVTLFLYWIFICNNKYWSLWNALDK